MKLRASLLALVIAAIGGALLFTYLKRFEAEASGGAKVAVLMTVRTLEPGTLLRNEDIGERWVPQSYIETRAIRATSREQIANLRISAPLQAQQTLMWTDIVTANDDRQHLPDTLQTGMRAVTIKAEGRSSSLVRPGDRVDVIGIFSSPGNAETRTGIVLLQNVLVVGQKADGEGHHLSSESTDLALSLTLQNAQILAVAADKGKLSVAVRPRDDSRIVDTVEFPSSILLEAKKLHEARQVKHGPTNLDGIR
jgi:pilus assembly protein CpaB